MFCERTEINIKPVACRWRETTFSRGRPLLEQLRVRVHCLWRVAFLSLVVTERTQISVDLFFGTPRKWVKCEHSAPFGTLKHRLVS